MGWLSSTAASSGHSKYLYAIVYLLQIVVLVLEDHPMVVFKFSIFNYIQKKRLHNHTRYTV